LHCDIKLKSQDFNANHLHSVISGIVQKLFLMSAFRFLMVRQNQIILSSNFLQMIVKLLLSMLL